MAAKDFTNSPLEEGALGTVRGAIPGVFGVCFWLLLGQKCYSILEAKDISGNNNPFNQHLLNFAGLDSCPESKKGKMSNVAKVAIIIRIYFLGWRDISVMSRTGQISGKSAF